MDAERMAVDALNASPEVPATAYYDVPEERPGEFITVQRTGGTRGEGALETPTLLVQCWAGSRARACAVADAAARALLGMPGGVDDCFHVSIASEYRDRDMESGTARHNLVAQMVICG